MNFFTDVETVKIAGNFRGSRRESAAVKHNKDGIRRVFLPKAHT